MRRPQASSRVGREDVGHGTVEGLAVVDGRLITDLIVLREAIGGTNIRIALEALANVRPLRLGSDTLPRRCLHIEAQTWYGRRYWQTYVQEVVGAVRGRARTSVGGPVAASKLYIWSDEIAEAWVAEGSERLHRADGPAVTRHDGTREWWSNARRHRDDGPAVVSSRVWEWHVAGRLHREGGPARLSVKDTRLLAEWHDQGHPGRRKAVGPAAFVCAIEPYLRAMREWGDASWAATTQETIRDALADPACAAAVLEHLVDWR